MSCGNSTLQTVAPLGVLSDFNGENPQGIWTLRIRDIYTNDSGVLNAASVSICTQNYKLIPYGDASNDLIVSSASNDGNFNVQYISTSANKELEVFVYDFAGKRLFDEKYPNNGGFNKNIQMPHKPQSGVYFVVLLDGSVKKTAKMIIK